MEMNQSNTTRDDASSGNNALLGCTSCHQRSPFLSVLDNRQSYYREKFSFAKQGKLLGFTIVNLFYRNRYKCKISISLDISTHFTNASVIGYDQ